MVFGELFELFGKALFVQRFGKTNAAAAHFVFVSRANATPGGTDFTFAFFKFTRLVEGNM